MGGSGGKLTEGGLGSHVKDSDDAAIVSACDEPPVGGAKHAGVGQAIEAGKGFADFGHAATYRDQGQACRGCDEGVVWGEGVEVQGIDGAGEGEVGGLDKLGPEIPIGLGALRRPGPLAMPYLFVVGHGCVVGVRDGWCGGA
jgi:hypothetical protein